MQLPSEEEKDHRDRFDRMDTMELVDLWEEPMPDGVRELLLAEIGSRRYRIKSLPPPPACDAPSVAKRPLTAREMHSARVSRAPLWILAVAILQLIGVLLAMGSLLDEAESVDLVLTVGTLAVQLSFPLGLSASFFALYFYSRSAPRSALVIALVLFLMVHGAEAAVDPESIMRGIILKVLVISGLASGIWSASQIDKEDAVEPLEDEQKESTASESTVDGSSTGS